MRCTALKFLAAFFWAAAAIAGPALAQEKVAAHLYFRAPDGSHLAAEDRAMAARTEAAQQCRELLAALFSGPRQKGVAVLPKDTPIRAVFVDKSGTAFVDLGQEARQGLPGGVLAEALSVWSVVNTLTLNVEGVKRVQILLEGRPAQTFGGHVDISRPLAANMLLVR